jgi:hypothetical protein
MYVSQKKFNKYESWPWDSYHYVKIIMKSGEVLYLTSLLYPSGIEKILNKYLKVSYWRVKQWFPTTLYNPPMSDDDSESLDEDF